VHAVLIENPKAGRVAPGSLRVTERALEATFELELVTTNARGHAAALAREAVEAGAKTIIAYGGDGTVNEIVNGMIGAADSTDVALAVLPGGSTNVLARNLGYPNDLVEATAHLIDLVEKGEPKRLKIGRITAQSEHGRLQRDFAFAAGLVLDAEIVRRVDLSKRRHRKNDGVFLYHGIRSFLKLRGALKPHLSVETPTGPEEAYWACIATTDPFTYFRKRPLRVVPGAGQGNGLALVASKQVRFWRTLRWLTQTLSTAKHVRHDELIHLVDQNEIRITCNEPVPLQTDGEFLGHVTDVRAIPLAHALPVWA
jgi:diacylglycerol kinase family enzyme